MRKEPQKEGPIVLRDSILALGLPSAELAKKINNAQAIAFLGQERTYLLVTGGDQLIAISKSLAPDQVRLIADNHGLYIKDQTTWGTLTINYVAQPENTISSAEATQLSNLGFKRLTDQVYTVHINVEGKVYPSLPLPSTGAQAFHKTRTLVFHAPPIDGGHPGVANLAFLPAALAVDVVTSPLQLLGFILIH